MDENNKNIQSRVSSIQNSQMPHSEDKWKKKKEKLDNIHYQGNNVSYMSQSYISIT